MASKARLYGASVLLGALMLPAHGAPQPVSSPSATPFLQAVRTQATVSSVLAPLFRLPHPQLETASAASANPPTTPTVVVKEGQSLWDIAAAHGVSVEAIVAANGLRNAELIHPGQRLLIPGVQAAAPAPARGEKTASARRPVSTKAEATRRAQPIWIVVQPGQTLSEIAEQQGTSIRTVVQANGLRSAEMIRAGQRLMIPGRRAAGEQIKIALPLPVSPPSDVLARSSGFVWPARGVLTSRFGWRWRRHHDGIDIAAPYGTPIYAARSGRVIFAGWYYGYGRSVIIDHGGGLTTLYGHASTLLVRSGEVVEAGEPIGRVGCSGHCYGSHLHFEIRLSGRAVNPLKYL